MINLHRVFVPFSKLLGVLLVSLVFTTSPAKARAEPEFDGIPLSVWTSRLANDATARLAARVLCTFGDRAGSAAPALAAQLGHHDRGVRNASAVALSQLGGPAIEALRPILRHSDASVRARAASILGRIGPAAQPVADELALLLDDSSERARLEATRALWFITGDAKHVSQVIIELRKFGRTLQNFAGQGISTSDFIVELGPAAVPAMRSALGAAAWTERAAVAEAWGSMGVSVAHVTVPALISLLADANKYVRQAAALALGQLGGAATESRVALTDALRRESDPYARERLAVGLWQVGDRQTALTELRAALSEPLGGVAAYAAAFLGKQGAAAREAVPDLIATLEHTDPQARTAAVKALGGIGPAAADSVPALLEALNSSTPALRTSAALALWRIAHHRASLPALMADLSRRSDFELIATIQSLAEMGSAAEPAVPQLMDAARHTQVMVRIVAAEALWKISRSPFAVSVMIAALTDAWYVAPPVAAMALGAIGPAAAAAVPALTRAYLEGSEEAPGEYAGLRQEAGKALEKIDPVTARKLHIR